MDLKTAKIMTDTFTQNGKTITPGLSDDWTYSFGSYYNSEDKVILKSEKLNFTVLINTGIQSFFRDFIYTSKIIIKGDKLIGNIGFNKYNIYLEDEFNEALRVVEDSEISGVIENNELIEFGVYLDDKGDEFVYLGHMEYEIAYLNNLYLNEKKAKKRYIVKYTDNDIDYNNPIIQKTGKRKFIELIRTLNIKERAVIFQKLFDSSLYSASMIIRKNGNVLHILSEELRGYVGASGIVKYDGKYGYYNRANYLEGDSDIFYEIEFNRFCKDLENNSFSKIKDYSINKIKNFEFDYNKEIIIIKFYLDYE